jgi:hypothetical protein
VDVAEPDQIANETGACTPPCHDTEACIQTYMEAMGMTWQYGQGVEDSLFSVVLTRSHCSPDTEWQQREGGEPYDTVKPISSHGFDLSRTVLIDDSARKVLSGERDNALVLPTFLRATV